MDTLAYIEILVRVLWIAGAVCFVLGLVRMNSPATARNGNLLSAAGMTVAIVATAVLILSRQLLGDGFVATGWIIIVVGIIIGSITFSGSLIASGKLQGLIAGKPILIPGGQLVTGALALITVVAAIFLFATGTPNVAVMLVILAAALIFGITMTLPIGGADMPVVISM